MQCMLQPGVPNILAQSSLLWWAFCCLVSVSEPCSGSHPHTSGLSRWLNWATFCQFLEVKCWHVNDTNSSEVKAGDLGLQWQVRRKPTAFAERHDIQ